MGDGKLCRAGQELRRNVRAVHEQHSQLFRALAQFSSSGNAVSDSFAAPARAYPPPAVTDRAFLYTCNRHFPLKYLHQVGRSLASANLLVSDGRPPNGQGPR